MPGRESVPDEPVDREAFPRFERAFFDSTEDFTVIGAGSLGGKARGLAFIHQFLASHFDSARFPNVDIHIPRLTVITTDAFDAFMKENDLAGIAASDESDDRIAHAFQKGSIPATIVGDLRALIAAVHQPLAVRSSSKLEDALLHPFAGVYETKMIPNNQLDVETRFRKLVEAIKFVWASTFFREAKSYIRSTGRAADEEKMAVIIQEVVGRRHGERFYPDVSGVGRSYNFYPMGHAEPKDGVVNLALGLGKTIVDGGLAWNYVPAYPRANPPYGTLRDLLYQTQTTFWAVNMGKPPAFDPIKETEYLVQSELEAAEVDGTLRYAASTYDAASDRLVSGIAIEGPRVLTFAPLIRLDVYPINDLLQALLRAAEEAVNAPVEIEFAIALPASSDEKAQFGFLQLRPMVVSGEEIVVSDEDLSSPANFASSEAVLGNGACDEIADIVYVRQDSFDTSETRTIAAEVERLNRALVREGRPYLLIGYGRWGSSDPWLGIPVTWAQISGAKAIVESSLPGIQADPSQGSHFFHNITSFRVFYFSVRHTDRHPIDWGWLQRQGHVTETTYVRHARLDGPLRIRVDGRTGRGVIVRPDPGGDS
jgi:hypothetical protein